MAKEQTASIDWRPTCKNTNVLALALTTTRPRSIQLAAATLLSLSAAFAEPVTVRHVQGSFHGFVVLKDMDDKTLAAGDVVQTSTGNRVTNVLSLHFRDGSLQQETSVYTQRRVYQLVSYKQVQKGPAFKTPSTLTIDVASKRVDVEYTDKDGKPKTASDKMDLPPDLANGLIPMLLAEMDPAVEKTLSMVVSTPKPRVVKLKISSQGQEPFSIGGAGEKAVHHVIKIDIGGIVGVAAKITGKQPPDTHLWTSADNAPVFLKSEGPLFEDGPIWRIELASPAWPKAAEAKR